MERIDQSVIGRGEVINIVAADSLVKEWQPHEKEQRQEEQQIDPCFW